MAADNNETKTWLPDTVGIGIDFGMTYSGSAIAFKMPGGGVNIEPVPINSVIGETKFPTVVYVSPDQQTIDVGEDARAHEDTENIHELFKRYLGEDWSPRPGLNAVYLTRAVLEAVKRDIDDYLRRKGFDREQIKRKYVFTFPGAWDQERILALKSAIEQAGFGKDYTLLDEALATAIGAAQVDGTVDMLGRQQTTLVCDFGGGTTDFSLAQATATGLIRVKFASGGNPLLGMSNLDKVIAMLVAETMNQLQPSGKKALRERVIAGRDLETAWREYQPDARWKASLLHTGETVKRNAFKNWRNWQGEAMKVRDGTFKEVTKTQLEPFVASTLDLLKQNIQTYLTESVERGKLPRNAVRFIVVGGGGSALPGIGEAIQQVIPGNPELLNINATIATSLVQRGAAFHGLDSTVYDRRSLHTYGVKTYLTKVPTYSVEDKDLVYGDPEHGGMKPKYYPHYEIYVNRNDKISPGTTITRQFTPLRANQSAVAFEVLTGEDMNPLKNRHIGEVELPLPANAPKDYPLDCEFTIGKDNLLLVRATGKDKQNVEVKLRWQVDTHDS